MRTASLLAKFEKAAKESAAQEEATKTLNYLASFPAGTTTVDRATLRVMLLNNSGSVFAMGHLMDIKNKHLGAGVYKVWLQKPDK